MSNFLSTANIRIIGKSLLIIGIFFISCQKSSEDIKEVAVSKINGKWLLLKSEGMAYAPANKKGPFVMGYTPDGGYFTIEKDSVWTTSEYKPNIFTPYYDSTYQTVGTISISVHPPNLPTVTTMHKVNDSIYVHPDADTFFIKTLTDTSLITYRKIYKAGHPGILTTLTHIHKRTS